MYKKDNSINNSSYLIISTKHSTSNLYRSNSTKALKSHQNKLNDNKIINNAETNNLIIRSKNEEFICNGKALRVDSPEELHLFYVEIQKMQKEFIKNFDK